MTASDERALSLAALTVLELTPPEMVSCAAQAGYSHVGLRLIPATPDEVQHDFVGDTSLARETRARLDDTCVSTLDVEIFRLKPDTDVARYEAALATGARLGARNALVAGNDPEEARLIDRFALFCDLAAGYGIAANLEPMPWTNVPSFADGVRIVTNARRQNGAVLIDAIHFDRAGSAAAEIAGVATSRLRYFQICDAPRARPATLDELLYQARERRLLPGHGGLDLAGIVDALPRELPIGVEIPNRERTRAIGAFAYAREALEATRAWLASHSVASHRQ